MIDITYRGQFYRLVVNKELFKCINVLFVGYFFMDNKQYKKYINSNNLVYLVEV